MHSHAQPSGFSHDPGAQSQSEASEPWHLTPCNKKGCLSWGHITYVGATWAPPQSSCRQMTAASCRPQWSPHTGPRRPPSWTRTSPSQRFPPLSRTTDSAAGPWDRTQGVEVVRGPLENLLSRIFKNLKSNFRLPS